MIIPHIVVDNFFDSPDDIRNYGLSLDYNVDDNGYYPGKRSQLINNVNPTLFNLIVNKVVTVLFNSNQNINLNCDLYFQQVDSKYKGGWIHQDNPFEISFLIYLDENKTKNEGTSIYKPKDITKLDLYKNIDLKVKSYLNTTLIPEVEPFRVDYNNQYEETLYVDNIYNRLFCFDSKQYHGVREFNSGINEPRLFLIGFISRIESCDFPLRRAQNILL